MKKTNKITKKKIHTYIYKNKKIYIFIYVLNFMLDMLEC